MDDKLIKSCQCGLCHVLCTKRAPDWMDGPGSMDGFVGRIVIHAPSGRNGSLMLLSKGVGLFCNITGLSWFSEVTFPAP